MTANSYHNETKAKYEAAAARIKPCTCGNMPELNYPTFTTDVCTFVRCHSCGRIAHGNPEDPGSAVDNWNKAIDA